MTFLICLFHVSLASYRLILGEFIVEYAGKLISHKTAVKRDEEYEKDGTRGSFMFFFTINNVPFCIDATEDDGRLGRMINHSKRYFNSRPKTVVVRGSTRLILMATRNIKAGEEIFFDYGDRSKETIEYHPWLAH